MLNNIKNQISEKNRKRFIVGFVVVLLLFVLNFWADDFGRWMVDRKHAGENFPAAGTTYVYGADGYKVIEPTV